MNWLQRCLISLLASWMIRCATAVLFHHPGMSGILPPKPNNMFWKSMVGSWNFLLKMVPLLVGHSFIFFFGGGGKGTVLPIELYPWGTLELLLPGFCSCLAASSEGARCGSASMKAAVTLYCWWFRISGWPADMAELTSQFSPWDTYMISLHPDC